MEGKKQELVGKVVSDACNKTITIEVVTYKKHPLYKKNVPKIVRDYISANLKNKKNEGRSEAI